MRQHTVVIRTDDPKAVEVAVGPVECGVVRLLRALEPDEQLEVLEHAKQVFAAGVVRARQPASERP